MSSFYHVFSRFSPALLLVYQHCLRQQVKFPAYWNLAQYFWFRFLKVFLFPVHLEEHCSPGSAGVCAPGWLVRARLCMWKTLHSTERLSASLTSWPFCSEETITMSHRHSSLTIHPAVINFSAPFLTQLMQEMEFYHKCAPTIRLILRIKIKLTFKEMNHSGDMLRTTTPFKRQ